MSLVALDEAVGAVADADPTTLADEDAIRSLYANLTRLEAVVAKATAAFDAQGRWAETGARSGAHWIARRCNFAIETVKKRLRIARALRTMPATDAAYSAGEISTEHVRLLAGAKNPATEEAFANKEAELIGIAKASSFGSFAKQVCWFRYLSDSEGAEADARKLEDQREAYCSQSFEDLWFGNFTLPPIPGVIFSNELKRLTDKFFQDDWAEAKERLGRDPHLDELRRSPAQRRADALVEMATRSASLPPGSRRPEPLFTVVVGWETLNGPICELANGRFVTPGSLAEWLPHAWLERVVFDGPSRVIDVGVARRLFEGATRKAVLTRDRECFHDYCETPASECQADHIIPWAAGGPTEQSNGRAACAHHNRARNRRKPRGP